MATKDKLFNLASTYWLPFLSGVFLISIQPPISLFPLAFIALIPLLGAVDKNSLRYSFFAGYVTGVVSYLGLIYWIVVAMNQYGGIPVHLSVLILLLFVLYLSCYMGIATLSSAWLEKRFSVPRYLSLPLLWILAEFARGSTAYAFPWSFLAHSQYTFLPFIQVVSITGTYFISFLIAAVNGIFFSLWRKERPSLTFMIVISALLAATFTYGFVRLSDREDEPRKSVAIIQGNIRQDVKWDDAFKNMIVRKYSQMTLSTGRTADLIVWPETAMPFVFDQETSVNSHVKNLPPAVSADLLFGTISKNAAGRYRNASYVIGKNGETLGVYNKVHLVPFGEYTPLVAYLPFLEKLTASGGDFVSGEGHVPIKTDIGPVGVLICYEGVFPYITNETVRQGAQVLVNLTNDAWYNRTSAPFQHFAFYIFRAIETDRYMLRAANTGISAIINPKGRVEASTPIFTEEILKGSFIMKNTRTFYVRFGDYFILLALFALVMAAGIGWRRKAGTRKS